MSKIYLASVMGKEVSSLSVNQNAETHDQRSSSLQWSNFIAIKKESTYPEKYKVGFEGPGG